MDPHAESDDRTPEHSRSMEHHPHRGYSPEHRREPVRLTREEKALLESPQNYVGPLIGTTLFALVFLLVGRIERIRESRNVTAVSFSAGVAIAYVFVDVMPHLASHQRTLLNAGYKDLYDYVEHHAYLVALLGFMLYLAASLRAEVDQEQAGPPGRSGLWQGPIAGVAMSYVGLIAYMLTEQPDHRHEPIALFTLAMAIHMYGVAHHLRQKLGQDYEQLYRYVIAGSVYAGWLIGVLTELAPTTYALWFSFMAGSVLSFSVTVELRSVDAPRRFGSFAAGAGTMTALILMLEFFGQLE
jgi:hypothetical protein